MRNIYVGSLVAAIVMFALGFVFFGLLMKMMVSPLGSDAAAAVQAALATHLPASGSYMVPMEEAAWMAGPNALVHFTTAGDVPGVGMAFGLGFVQLFITALLLGFALKAAGGDFARQSRIVLWLGIGMAFFFRLGDPIWYGYGWRMPLFYFVADAVILIAAGLVLARWTTSDRAATV